MQNVLIFGQNLKQQRILQDCIQSKFSNWDVTCVGEIQKAKLLIENSLDNGYFSLFLLEVELDGSGLNGFELAEEIRSRLAYQYVPIIFLSSTKDGIQQAISDYHCYNYLVKPYTPADIMEQLRQMRQTGYLRENLLNISDTSRVRYHINMDDICCIEAQSHRVKISTLTNEIVSRQISFGALKELLAKKLIPCHKKYLINMQHLSYFDKPHRKVKVHNHIIPVSRTYLKTVSDMLNISGR